MTGKLSAAKFEDIMKKFNAIEENNGNTGEYGAKEKQPKTIADSKKIQLLQSELTKMGFSVKLYDTSEQGYNSSTGEGNRNTNLCANGKPLKQTDYPGTILPTSCS